MARRPKKAQVVRKADEFAMRRLLAELVAYRTDDYGRRHTLEQIYTAREAQMRGEFALPARLAESMRTDDAIFVPRANRLEPLKCASVEIKPAVAKSRAESIAAEAVALYGQNGVGITPGALTDINDCLVDHGVAIGVNVASQRDDGSRVDLQHSYWPIDWVRYDSTRRILVTRVDPLTVTADDLKMPDPSLMPSSGFEVPIVHGDGRWTIYAGHADRPWRKSAAILAAATVFARHAFAARDWSKGSQAHGNMKFIGELPEGVALQKDGTEALSPEAEAMIELMHDLASSDMPIGMKPAGSKVEVLEPEGNAWEVWAKLVENAEKAAARIYLGTDGTLGSSGGAPGVDIKELFGVALTKVQSDVEIISRGFREGVLVPWTALNFGDSRLAPSREYVLPDQDADAARESLAKRRQAFYTDLASAKQAGMVIDQGFVDELATAYNVTPPKLAAIAPAAGDPLGQPAPANPELALNRRTL